MREYNRIRSRAFLGVCKDATRESARFAIWRSWVRSPHGPYTKDTPVGVSFVYDPLRGSPMKESRSDSLATSLRRLHMPVYHSEVVGHDPRLHYYGAFINSFSKSILSSRCQNHTLHERATRGSRSPYVWRKQYYYPMKD